LPEKGLQDIAFQISPRPT